MRKSGAQIRLHRIYGRGEAGGFLLSALCCMILFMAPAVSAERIKDIGSFEGVRTNQVIGFGLVAGLDGAGDKGNATMQTIANMLQRMGVTVLPNDIKAKNTAAVMVTASLPPFPKPGMRIDALVSTIADAKSLQGGTLLLTPMKGPDGNVYALAQGPVSIGGFIGGGGGTATQKNHVTAGKVPEGVIIERDLPFTLANDGEIRFFLSKSDFATASAVARKINEAVGAGIASTIDSASVRLAIPKEYRNKVVEFITVVEAVEVAVDTAAKVVVNERTGTIVIGEKVRIAPVAISHGNLTIEIKTDIKVSQPPPFAPAGAETMAVSQKDVKIKEEKASLVEISGVTLGEVVKGLNALGVTPRDLISILQALKASGALRAELEII